MAAGRAAVISEEGPGIWAERCRKLGIGSHVSFFCRPFLAKPTLAQWHGLLEAMRALRRREGLDLVVIDTLAMFLPGSNENTAGVMLNCLLPLDALKAEGVAVLLVHHPRKGVSAPGQAARGSGALAGYVDILIEKGWVGRPDDASDRRRWLRAFSRSEQTRRQAVVELTADGTDYLDRGTLPDEPSAACWEVLRLVLEEASERVTQRQILEQWPEDYVKPDVGTVSRTLKRAMAEGRVQQQGTGRKNDPFRYWLPARVEELDPGPGAAPEARARWERRCWEKAWVSLGLEAPPLRAERTEEATPPPAQAVAPVPAPANVPPPMTPAPRTESGRPLALPSLPPSNPAPPRRALIPSPSEPEPLPEMAPPPPFLADLVKAPPPDPKTITAERPRVRRWPGGEATDAGQKGTGIIPEC